MSSFDDYLNAGAPAAAKPSFDSYLGSSAPTAQAAPVLAQSAPAPVPAPAQPQGQWQVPGGFLMGVGDIVRGGAQDITHGLSWAANKIAPNSQFAKDAAAALPQMQQTIDQQNAQYAAQRAANGGSGVDLSRIAGNVVGTAPTMAMGGGGASLLGRVGMGALQGAAGAGLMPTTGDQSFGTQKLEQLATGGALGAAVPAVFSGARSAGNALWNAAQPVVQPGRFVGSGMANAMSPQEAAQAAANIRSAHQFVPGSVPTTAQAAATPTLVQTEKAASNFAPVKNAMLDRGIANNDARWQALMGVAQDPQWQAAGAAQTPARTAMEAAQDARSAAATPLYDAAHQATANVGPAFMRYAQIPEMQEAMQRANQIASLDSAVGRGVAPVWPQQGGSQAINGAALDYTSRALGDMIGEANRTGATTRAGALAALKGNVDNWMGRYIPGVQQARAAYAAGSVPINTMDVGQQIANGLGTRAMNAGGAPEIQMMPFRAALTKAMNSGDASTYGIDANALSSLQGIGQDLQRATISNSVRTPGSDTAYNLAANGWLARNLYGPNFQGATGIGKGVAAAAALLSGHPIAAGGVLAGGNRVGQMVGDRLQGHLADYLLNSQAILPYLDTRAAAAAQPVPNALAQRLLQYGRPAAVNALTSGLNNANH